MILSKSLFRCNFSGLQFDNISKKEIISRINTFMNSERKYYITVLNANKIYLMNKNNKLKTVVENSDIILPENAINIVSFLSGKKLKNWNIGGCPTMKEIISLSAKHGYSLFFLGSTDIVLEKMINNLKQKYTNLKITGYHNGYFGGADEDNVIEKINNIKPDILFVGMGSPKQELWIGKNINKLKIKIAMGVGGSFKVFAGIEKEAPLWTKFGIEWLYRSLQDPIKFKRYIIINSFFIFNIFIKKIILKIK